MGKIPDTEEKISLWMKNGRGQGQGPDYQPWIEVSDFASRGRSHRIFGRVTGRVHHFLSDLERNAFMIYDFKDEVVDIREQYPLYRERTERIAQDAGIKHPFNSKSETALVMTTDLLIDIERDGVRTQIARCIKPSSQLSEPRTIQKLELERRYWLEQSIDWGIITERDMPKELISNLLLLGSPQDLDHLQQPYPGYFAQVAEEISNIIPHYSKHSLREFAQQMDQQLGLRTGNTLALVYHLISSKRWLVDMMIPITDTISMSALRLAPQNQHIRAQA